LLDGVGGIDNIRGALAMAASNYDCTRCGACCFNPPENVAEGFEGYVEVEARDKLRERADLLERYARERDGQLHLRILEDGRCMALSGSLGRKVSCRIYHFRPSPCRRVQAGSELCLRYRREQGLATEPR
jgi:Fe-S-cluster containining protein